MNKFFLLLFSAILLFSCADNSSSTQQKEIDELNHKITSLERNKAVLEKNKKVVMDFYQEFFGDHDLTAAERYIGDVYIQHNPAVADGRTPLVEAAKIWLKDTPKTTINFHNVIAEDDLVFVHIVDTDEKGTKHSTMDVFRVTDGKISEHWDAFATFKKEDKSANDNPLF